MTSITGHLYWHLHSLESLCVTFASFCLDFVASVSLGQWERVAAVGVLYERHVGRPETQGHLL